MNDRDADPIPKDHAVASNCGMNSKTGMGFHRVFGGVKKEIAMVPWTKLGNRALAPTLASLTLGILMSDAALASQGPGAGAGTAGHLTQTAMAIAVYGTSALIVCAGLIGAARGQKSR